MLSRGQGGTGVPKLPFEQGRSIGSNKPKEKKSELPHVPAVRRPFRDRRVIHKKEIDHVHH
jgi:hypothetical protein